MSHKTSGKKELRDSAIKAKALAGAKRNEIAEELGISRQTVSRALNNDQMRAVVKEAEARLHAMITDALDALHETITSADPATRQRGAIALLKSLGAMRDAPLEVHSKNAHLFIIEKRDGSEIHLGARIEGDEDGTEAT